ncbi:hypothetical protein [Neobacillus sp. PS3-40]|uniref:hypothetical protein n=1 Tax=Neobacillus sp. PS3-40 TaxID=3070679 RepID=UPI0027DFE820|nr:hypothetical protein [Neobacillus sp. PS3-40]WML43267.1 hypothetical protein RCG20_15905 [Neobacillus sp. PS3-40]
MKKIVNLISFSFGLSFIALIIIVFDSFGSENANLLLGFNPILKLFIGENYSLIVVEKLQLKEPSSIYIHYSLLAYLIHFASFVLLGLLIDVIKFSFQKPNRIS